MITALPAWYRRLALLGISGLALSMGVLSCGTKDRGLSTDELSRLNSPRSKRSGSNPRYTLFVGWPS